MNCRSRQEEAGSNMAVGSGSNKQPPISRPTTTSNGSMNGLNGSGSLVLSSLLAPSQTAGGMGNGFAQSIAATLATSGLASNVTSGLGSSVASGGSTSPTNQMINGIPGQCNGLKGFMMDRSQQPPPQPQYLSGLSSPLPNLCVNSSLSQVCLIRNRNQYNKSL